MRASSATPRVVTATLNTALDVTLGVEGLRAGEKQKIQREHVQAGGKGVNVARALARLGVPALALVTLGGATGRQIQRSLERDALPNLALDANGESRICLELVEPDGRATQLHGAGIDGADPLAERVVAAIETLPTEATWFALCGSLPPGMPPRAARDVLEAARRRGFRTAVDIRGPALREAAATAPDLLRINSGEFRELSAEPLATWMGERSPAHRLAIVSDGAAPCEVVAPGTGHWRVHPPRIEAVNAIGCGDAMMAGLLAALIAEAPLEEVLRRGTALAAAEALSPIAGSPDPSLAETLLAGVRLERLEPS